MLTALHLYVAAGVARTVALLLSPAGVKRIRVRRETELRDAKWRHLQPMSINLAAACGTAWALVWTALWPAAVLLDAWLMWIARRPLP